MKKTHPQKKQEVRELRDRAEKALKDLPAKVEDVPVEDVQKLIHELRVHQVELEMQNDELRETQAALARSRDRYLELFDFAPIGYFTLDKKNLIVEVNLAGAELLGLERALLIRKQFSRFIAPDSQDAFYFHRKRALASEDMQVCELVLVNQNGARFHAQLRTVSVDGGKQGSNQLHIAIMDITARIRLDEKLKEYHDELERKVEARTNELTRANLALQEEVVQRRGVEHDLRDSERKYRIVVENANEGMIVGQDGKIKFLNARFADILGYSKEELIGMPVGILVHPDDAAMVKKLDAQAKQGRVWPQLYTTRMVDKAGQTRWLRGKRVPVEWNDRPALLSFLEDITVQMRSEQVLREIDEQLKYIFLESPIGIAVYDAQGHMYGVNESYLDIYGISDPVRIIGTSLFADPGMGSRTKEMLLAGKAIREEMCFDDAKNAESDSLDTASREMLHLDVMITPLGMSKGDSVVGYMAQVQDITEQKHAERSIHALSQQLIRAQETERQMISRELHDRLGQDISTLKISFDALRHETKDLAPGVQETMADLSKLMQKAVSDIRDLAYELRPPGLDQIGFQRTISQFVEDFHKKTGIEVEMKMMGIVDLVHDSGAEINLYRLIQESLNNIQKHARAKRVVIKMVASYPSVILRIKDDGIGFDPKARRLTVIREKRMGLRNMEERAMLLGGKMSILSQPGRGTEIRIEVPCLGRKNG